VTRVAAIIFHPPPMPGAGPLVSAFEATRRANAERQAEGFRRAGADVVTIEEGGEHEPFGRRLQRAVGRPAPDGLIVLGSGSIPLATVADRRAFVETAAGPNGHAVANNRYSADLVAAAGCDWLGDLPAVATDNGLPRWLEEQAGYTVTDLRRRWRLQVDLDTPLDGLLVGLVGGGRDRRGTAVAELASRGVPTAAIRSALAAVRAVSRDPRGEMVVAGRASAAGLAWLERFTASRTRALIEERGFRTRPVHQRPVRSSLGLLLGRDGPGALGLVLAELGDAAVVDTRVLMAHQFGSDEGCWPAPEDRFASDLLLPAAIRDPWLRDLTRAALEARLPIVLGGHTLVGPGLRLAIGEAAAWT
jgi:hypothetical protein